MRLLQNKIVSAAQIAEFQALIWNYYAHHERIFEWRKTNDPYQIVVSEIMLQQTQTYRVEKKFEAFIAAFPTFQILAQARLRDVLAVWQGLGYNRRGAYLHAIAIKIMNEFNGILPANPAVLESFPGIGKATAASICAFAYNMPTIFIETNIRAVFIHEFFNQQEQVHDKEIFSLVSQAVDYEQPRQWYYALMDYGVMLKKNMPNPSRKSAHHAKQSRFEGSDRQIRGKIIKLLTKDNHLNQSTVCDEITKDQQRFERILNNLLQEGIVKRKNHLLFIP